MTLNLIISLSILFHLSISSFVFGQETPFKKYHHFKSKLNYQDSIGNLDSAMIYCDSMIKHVNFYPYDYYQGFTISQRNGDFVTANEYLVIGTTKGLQVNSFYGEELNQYFQTELGQTFLTIQDSLIQKHKNSIDLNYYLELEKLYNRDQSIRDGSKEMEINDSIIFDELIQLSEKKHKLTKKRH